MARDRMWIVITLFISDNCMVEYNFYACGVDNLPSKEERIYDN